MTLTHMEVPPEIRAEAENRKRRLEKTPEFLGFLFTPADQILIHLVETWTEGGRRNSRINYHLSDCRTLELCDRYRLAMFDLRAERKLENI